MRYWVVYEQAADGTWSAYLPDVLGCVAAADTREETAQLIREALAIHLAGMAEDGDPAPSPSSEPWAEEVEIEVPSLTA